mmetsp:Transcript_17305/g.27320  ORF Transcript_17305/g.27320 Transcript_17305/m.27320 type:complete len:213 (-) Transcript_17305:46-684(-)
MPKLYTYTNYFLHQLKIDSLLPPTLTVQLPKAEKRVLVFKCGHCSVVVTVSIIIQRHAPVHSSSCSTSRRRSGKQPGRGCSSVLATVGLSTTLLLSGGGVRGEKSHLQHQKNMMWQGCLGCKMLCGRPSSAETALGRRRREGAGLVHILDAGGQSHPAGPRVRAQPAVVAMLLHEEEGAVSSGKRKKFRRGCTPGWPTVLGAGGGSVPWAHR